MKHKLLSLFVATIVAMNLFAESGTCGVLAKITATAKNAGTIEGEFAGTVSVSAGTSTTYEGQKGYKLSGQGSHIGATFTDGTLKAGDKVIVFVTQVSDGKKLQLFSDKGTTLIAETDELKLGENIFVLDDRAEGGTGLFAYRTLGGSEGAQYNAHISTITLRRLCGNESSDASLKYLTVNDDTIKAENNIYNYEISDSYQASTVKVKYELNDPGAKSSKELEFTIFAPDEAGDTISAKFTVTAEDNSTVEYTINISSKVIPRYSFSATWNEMYGNVTTVPNGTYKEGTVIQLSATPNYGYHFTHWSDGVTDNPHSFTLTQDTTFAAEFANNPIITYKYDALMGSIEGAQTTPAGVTADYITMNAIPNYGYHFVKWADGNKDNPRTIYLDRDTTFTAEFGIDKSGKCGDDLALTWTYDSKGKALTISGKGTLNSNYTFGAEAPTSAEKLIIAEGVATVGNSAFSGYSTLKQLSIAASVKTIYEQAFYNCTGLEAIYSYRATPPTAYSNTFDGIEKFGCVLYVLSASVDMYKAATGWRDFYFVEPIDAEEVTELITDVKVEPTDNTVEVTWPVEEQAATYTLEITKDGVLFCTLTFNANGQLTGIAFAPSRNGTDHQAPAAVKTSNGGLRFTVTGLDSDTNYHLKVNAKDSGDQVIATYSSNFTTTCVATGIDDQLTNDKCQMTNKILRDGQILILRGEKVYTVTGQEVK